MATVTLTGKTFEHRFTLKELGGKWNADRKEWSFTNASDATLASLKGLPGIGLTQLPDSGAPAPMPPRREPVAPAYDGGMIVYGDAPDYGPFAHGKPRVYGGFSSLNALCDFVETTPDHIRSDNSDRSHGWISGNTEFFGSSNMSAALKLARDGWPEGVEKAKRALEIIESENAVIRARKMSVAGGRVNVGKMLSGNPLHMTTRARAPGRRVVTLYVATNMSAEVDTNTAIIRATTVAAMADILEASGFSCEIVAVAENKNSSKGPAITNCTVVLKHASDPLNINDIVFGVGHPSMQRRLVFTMIGYDNAASAIHKDMGYPGSAFTADHPTGPNEFYIDRATVNVKEGVKFDDAVRALFPTFVPDNFPVSLK